ncbi:MAG: 30S ribosome-binding factor RbfA [Myxococcota bacterium]
MSIRPKRVGSEIQKVLSAKLLKTPAFLTILDVEVTPDLSAAKVFFSLFGSDEKCQQTLVYLEQEKKALRQEIGRQVKLRLTPELIWIRDDTPERADRIHQLLK